LIRRYDRHGLEDLLGRSGYTGIRTRGFNLAGVPAWWLTYGLAHRDLEGLSQIGIDEISRQPGCCITMRTTFSTTSQ